MKKIKHCILLGMCLMLLFVGLSGCISKKNENYISEEQASVDETTDEDTENKSQLNSIDGSDRQEKPTALLPMQGISMMKKQNYAI